MLSIKYLGVILDEKLNFLPHIVALATKIRRQINIMKLLRVGASKDILRMVYIALSQSVLGYCIGVWGGAAKTHLILLERAQRALLKVMLHKPRIYPTSTLYAETGLLSIRKIYILKAVVHAHKILLNLPNYTNIIKKRVFNLHTPSIKTAFACRFLAFQSPRLYNAINRKCKLLEKSVSEVKSAVNSHLSDIDYITTETLLTVTL